MRHAKIPAAVAIALLLQLAASPASAVRNGESAVGDTRVLTLLVGQFSRTSFCSMSMVTERIIVTAAHCMAVPGSTDGSLQFSNDEVWVSQPGADVTNDDPTTRVRVDKVVLPPGYINTWDPDRGDRRGQINDIAFLFLEKPLRAGYVMPIATVDEIRELVAARSNVTHLGYGLQDVNTQDHRPHRRTLELIEYTPNFLDTTKVVWSAEGDGALCSGDSGGPWYASINGVEKLLAVLVAAGGCRGATPPREGFKTLGTVVAPFIPYMQEQWEIYLKEADTIRAARGPSLEAAIASGTFVGADGCHARGIRAALQILRGVDWVTITDRPQWQASANTCPSTHPVRPWTFVNEPADSVMRWRFWRPNVFDLFGPVFLHAGPPKQPVQFTIPEKTTTKTTSTSTKYVTCAKGKQIKRVLSSARCPRGFVRR